MKLKNLPVTAPGKASDPKKIWVASYIDRDDLDCGDITVYNKKPTAEDLAACDSWVMVSLVEVTL